MGRVLSLPGSLDGLASALRLAHEKDKEGRALMLRMCKPRKPRKNEPQDAIIWNETPEEIARLIAYCKKDVEVERAIYKALLPLSPPEQELWCVDQQINDRGVHVDLPAVRNLIELTEREKERLASELRRLTGREVPSAAATAKLLSWLDVNGCKLPDLTKRTVENALKDETNAGSVRRALEIRQEASKASVAKLKAMLKGAGADSRARGLLEYHGAGTGRWAGRRIQTQNMVRTPDEFTVSDAENVYAWAEIPGGEIGIRAEYKSPMEAVSYSLRSLICAAPGNTLYASDYSNIEGRMLSWLAGEEWKLKFFEDYDAKLIEYDNYKAAYAKTFGVPVETVTKPQRQIGKVQELALGYQGGHGAFLSMGANYGINIDEIAEAVRGAVSEHVWLEAVAKYWDGARETAEEALAEQRIIEQLVTGDEIDDATEDEVLDLAAVLNKKNRHGLQEHQWAAIRIIVDGWRAAHPNIVALWRALNEASIAAVANPGQAFDVGPIRYKMRGGHLYSRLPNGRALAYPYARLVNEEDQFKRIQKRIVYEGVNSRTRKWGKQRLYGGLLAENVTQAASRDILADAIKRLESRGYPIIMHVHDEIVAEVPLGSNAHSFEEFEKLMAIKEPWAQGLPVAVEGWQGPRYRK
jgi:DNA polymerase